MIVAVSSVKDEASIIERTVTHLLNNDVDEVIVSDGHSTDETRALIEGKATVIDQDGPFDQGEEITRLANIAMEHGANWVIPFDADEFWCAPEGTIKTVLDALPENVVVVHCPMFVHFTETIRAVAPKLWGKVCFRPTQQMQVAWGNHGVSGIEGQAEHGLLHVRELQYQSLEHFKAKVAKASALFASWDVPSHYGSHMRALVDLPEGELEGAWDAYCDVPTIEDPIPYRGI